MPKLKKKTRQMQPSRMLVLGFSIIILAGATLLFLPISSKSGQFSSFIDCLFTATSATCVTGITVFDTFNYFNGFGQGVILALIQVGGLGFLTLVTFINLILGKKLGWSTVKIAASDLTDNALETTPKRLFYEIFLYSFAIEFVGAVILSFVFVPDFGALGVFEAIFLSVSAFCNAGFDLLTATQGAVGLSNYTANPLVMITVTVLITTGGLGFIVWRNIRHYSKAKRLLLHTKLVLIMAAVMLLVGATIIFIVEFGNQDTLGQMPVGEKILTSIFLSASSRTAGFPCFDMNDLMPFTKIIITILMFIGAAPASTAGGIKITTVALVVCTVISVLKGREDTYLMGHRIKRDAIYKTFTVIVLSLTLIAVSFTGILMCCEGMSLQKTIFEVVSAFSTTGFSVGASAEMNVPAKLIMVFTMLAGRIGPVTLMTSLIIRKNHNSDKNRILPEGNILVG